MCFFDDIRNMLLKGPGNEQIGTTNTKPASVIYKQGTVLC